jgi:hypothetical protein
MGANACHRLRRPALMTAMENSEQAMSEDNAAPVAAVLWFLQNLHENRLSALLEIY